MEFRTKGLLVVASILGLAACTSTGSLTPAATADLATALTDAHLALTVYEATPLPAANVVKLGDELYQTANAAYGAYEANKNDTAAQADAAAAIAALTTYLLTAAPGNGVTPASVPAA